jgi:hypothetical protein
VSGVLKVQEKSLDLCFLTKQLIAKDNVQVILRQFLSELTEEERLYGWFQQDSATANTARMSMQALSDVFGDRIINNDIWPAGSPDLNPCDFFLLGLFEGQSLQQ